MQPLACVQLWHHAASTFNSTVIFILAKLEFHSAYCKDEIFWLFLELRSQRLVARIQPNASRIARHFGQITTASNRHGAVFELGDFAYWV
jgi:hypothetical protein